MKKRSVGPYFLRSLTSLLAVLALAFEAAAQTIPNPSFEADRYTNAPGYASLNGGVITGWTISNTNYTGLRLSPGSGPFANNGAVPDGANVAFIQTVSGAFNTLSTTISGLAPGTTYRVTFRANSRANFDPATGATWSLNGGAFVSFRASPAVGGSNPYYTNSATFTATGNTAALVLRNGLPTGNDATVLVDDFRITPVPGWSVRSWTNDASSGVVPGHTVWAYHFGSADLAIVNGINVPGIAGPNPSAPEQFVVSGIPNVFNGDSNKLTALGGSGSAVMAGDFIYGGNPGSITVQGLTIGEVYTLSFFGVGFDAPHVNHHNTFTSGPNSLAVNENSFGQGNGLRVDYSFVATTTTSLTTVTPFSDFTFHTYGLALRVSTPLVRPSVATTPVTAIKLTSATLNGRVTPGSMNATTWFEWGTTTNYGNFTPTNTLAATTNSQGVSHNLSGLISGNTYHYRMAASNAQAVSYGLNQTFTPPGSVPFWSVQAWTSDTSSGIMLEQTIWAYHFGSADVAVVNGVNVAGIATGNPSVPGQFTVAGIPHVFNGHVNNLTALGGSGSAVMAGDFIYGGNPGSITVQGLTIGEVYTLSFFGVGFDAPPTKRTSTFTSGTNSMDVNENLFAQGNGLRVDYSFVATTTNNFTIVPLSSSTFHTYGLALSGSTPITRPSVATVPATVIGPTSTTLNGRVTPGSMNATTWFEWGTTTNYGSFTPTITLAASTDSQAVSHTLTGLIPGNTYYYRVAAYNGLGTSYGLDASFTAAVFTNVPIAGLPGIWFSSAVWGDYDNDGRLDFLVTGLDNNSVRISQLWRNTGSGFTNVPIASLPAVNASSVAWGDYDNDDRLDFLLTGSAGSSRFSQLWGNTGSGFTNVPIAGLPGVHWGSVAWGDYDNDGRLDFLLTGSSAAGLSSQLWRNTGSGFTHVPIAGLPGVYQSSVAWGDYDNDGRLDFLLTGDTSSGNRISQLWRNTGSGFTHVPIAGLPGVAYSSVAWGDYDNDGRLDFLLTGDPGGGRISQLWRNTGSGFTHVPIAGLPGVYQSSMAWGDYDNDGRLDFLLTGGTSTTNVSQLWQNTGSGFTHVPIAGLPGVRSSSVAWGDYDNDGHLDFLLTGIDFSNNSILQLWRNHTPMTNAPPGAPTGLALTATTDSVMLSWHSATDDHTPAAGLTYNVRAGTTPGGIDLLAGHVDAANGFRRVPAMGNTYLRHSLPLTGLTTGQTVYWSVQAVDTAFAGGPFATETSVVSLPQLAITQSNTTDALVSWTPPTWGWSLQAAPGATGPWTNAPSGGLNPATVPLTNAPNTFFRLSQ